MEGLGALLARRIRSGGPLPLSEFMALALTHPDHGYYTTRTPLGAEGDFTTAPEISQMFGELLGLALAQAWIDRGSPAPFLLAEPGPGRGTLMADMLRATAGVPGFHAAARVVLVEVSQTLRARQEFALEGHAATWVDTLPELPDGPLFLVANEFFDALPIRQFRRDPAGWRERMVGLDGDALAFGWSPAAPVALLEHRLADTAPGDIVEVSPPAQAAAAEIAARIARFGGAAFLIDYGGWRSLGDTFQAMRGHAAADPLAAPGTADLTAHVDFEALARAALQAGAAHTPMTAQGVVLERLGITQRARALAASLSGAALDSHIAAHRRLTHPDEMGHLFQVMALYSQSSPPPPGLAP